MNTKILEYIVAIAEEGSITRAADRFYLSQPVLSRHLKNLEHEFGCPLFIRGKDGMQPTRAGILLINNAQSILHMEARLMDDLEKMRNQTQQRIRIMLDSTYYNFFISQILPAFRQQCTDAQVEVIGCNASQARRALITHEAELAIIGSVTPSDAELEQVVLVKDELVLVFRTDYEEDTSVQGLRIAVKNGLLPILHPISTTVRTIEEQVLAEAGIFPPILLEASGFQAALGLLSKMGGCTFLPSKLSPNFDPTHFNVSKPVSPLYTSALYRRDFALRGPVRILLQTITDLFSNFVTYTVTLSTSSNS